MAMRLATERRGKRDKIDTAYTRKPDRLNSPDVVPACMMRCGTHDAEADHI